MRLTWIGQTCFYIESHDGRSLLIDPFQRVIGLPRGDLPADVVVFSHTHIDHYDPGAVAPQASIVMGPGQHSVAGFRIFGVQAYHDAKEGLLCGEVTIYGISVDGFRIVHLSDIGEEPDDARLQAIGKPDVLLFPAGQHTTIDLRQAARLIDRLKPAIAIPMAFHLPGLLMPSTGLDEVKRTFLKHRCANRLELAPGTRLARQTEIRILDAVAYCGAK